MGSSTTPTARHTACTTCCVRRTASRNDSIDPFSGRPVYKCNGLQSNWFDCCFLRLCEHFARARPNTGAAQTTRCDKPFGVDRGCTRSHRTAIISARLTDLAFGPVKPTTTLASAVAVCMTAVHLGGGAVALPRTSVWRKPRGTIFPIAILSSAAVEPHARKQVFTSNWDMFKTLWAKRWIVRFRGCVILRGHILSLFNYSAAMAA